MISFSTSAVGRQKLERRTLKLGFEAKCEPAHKQDGAVDSG